MRKDKVFEPDKKELEQLAGDTHFVTDIQRRVKEMLDERGRRRDEIRQEIQAFDSRALPGVLNAAYVFTVQLKKRDQELLASLLAELVGENLAAREMLLRVGVLEAPFVPTRKTALMALQQLGNIREEEVARIRLRAWRDADRSGDYEAALALYEFLVQQEDSQSCSEIKRWAQELFEERGDIGPRFLDLALHCAPQDSYQILKDALGAMDREATEFSRAMHNIMSSEFVSNHMPQMLQAANEVKENTEGYAHKGIEHLFTGPIASYLRHHPDTVVDTGELISREYESLYRFWWQGLGELLKLEAVRQYFEDQTTSPLDEFTREGAVQLLFAEKDNANKLWALGILERLEESAPDQYQDVLDEFAKRQGKNVNDPGINPSRRSTLTKTQG